MAVFTIPKPEPTEVPSSNRHLPISKVTTFAPGCLIPILCKDVLPGDKMRINIDSLIESLPMVAPNLQGYKASFDFYFCPWSNYYGWMDNNKRSSTQEILDMKRHTLLVPPSSFATLSGSSSRPGVKAGSLLDYLGVPPGFCGDYGTNTSTGPTFVGRAFPAEKFLSVLDIYRTYYVNNQEEQASFVAGRSDGARGETDVLRVNLSLLDDIFIALRNEKDGILISTLSGNAVGATAIPTLDTFGAVLQYIHNLSLTTPLGGLPLRTYRMDLNRGIMSQNVGSVKSTVQVHDGGFSVDTLRLANKLQKLIDRIDISGGRFSDMMRVRWGVKPRGSLDVPDFLGSVSEFFGITDVVATASGVNNTADLGDRGNSVLGQQAGFAVNRLKRNNSPISFRADQFGTLVCMFSLVPIVTYSQGIEREDLKTKFSDIYDPAYSQLGYQDVDPRELSALPSFNLGIVSDITEPLAFANGPLLNGTSVGKRVAWSEYMSSLPRAHGLFAYGQELDFWANNRMYTTPELPNISNISDIGSVPGVVYGPTDYSTYINPAVQNNLFVDTSFTAQNFRLRVNFDIVARRNIGSRVMPHL